MSNQFRTKLLKHFASKHQDRETKSSGFTMLEILVVVIIIGVLSAIIGPNWIAFNNRQKLNSATNTVFTALRTAQSQAKKENKPKTVTINVTDGTIAAPNAIQETLDSKVKITSITRTSSATSMISGSTAAIIFDEKGIPYQEDATTYAPLTIRKKDALIPIQIKLKHDLIGQEQCVTISTLLGSIDTNCSLTR